MVQINFALKEVNCKIVYYGPGMSGKTTNIEIVHQKAPEQHKGELTSIATEGDRTLFFDFMPLDLGNIAGMRTKFQLYTVPGQVYYNSTRKLVLQGVDGIIFVADSQEGKQEENRESLDNLRNNLAEYGKDLDEIPLVIQYNKRDLPNVVDVEYMQKTLNERGAPTFEAVATTGEGVFPTLKALSAIVLASLSKEKRSIGSSPPREGKPKAAPKPRAAPKPQAAPEPVAAQAPATPTPTPRKTPLVRSIAEEFIGSGAGAPPPAAAVQPPAEAPLAPDAQVEQPPAPPAQPAPGLRVGEPDAPVRRGRRTLRSPSKTADPVPVREEINEWKPDPLSPEQRAELQRQSKMREAAASERARQPLKSPNIGKYVFEEDRGSPMLMVLLALIILVAVGVILYSFKVF